MSRVAIRAAAVSLGAVLSIAGAASVAEADSRSFTDPKPNLTKVTVKHRATTIKVTARTGVIRPGTYVTVYFDTDPSNPGPEYRNDLVPASELSPLMRIERFGQEGHAVRCDGLRGRGDVFGPKTVSVTVPRSCVGNPSKVRVSVRGYFDIPGPNVVDWAPGYRQLSGWVHR